MLVLADVEGENLVLFIAGTVGLAGILLGLIAVVVGKREAPYAWAMGFVALLLGSLAGAGGLWKVSGESGLIFLATALGIVLFIWGVLAGWSRIKPVADPETESAHEHSEQHRPE
jgi:hypothetical protein